MDALLYFSLPSWLFCCDSIFLISRYVLQFLLFLLAIIFPLTLLFHRHDFMSWGLPMPNVFPSSSSPIRPTVIPFTCIILWLCISYCNFPCTDLKIFFLQFQSNEGWPLTLFLFISRFIWLSSNTSRCCADTLPPRISLQLKKTWRIRTFWIPELCSRSE